MKKRTSSATPFVILLFGMIVVALWLASAWYLMDRFPDTAKLSESALQAAAVRGQFGDMFGGVNALFTALILSGAIYTVWLQHKQLDAMKQQQDDFKHENARTARLQAHAALVDAKSSLLNMRYQMAKDIQPHLQTVEPNSAISGQLFMIVKANYENAGNTMIELETLAKQLTAVLSDIPTSDQNAPNPPSNTAPVNFTLDGRGTCSRNPNEALSAQDS